MPLPFPISIRLTNSLIISSINSTLFSSNIASLIVFLSFGHVVWVVGLLMMLGQAIGAFLGTRYLFKVNPKAIRILIVIISLAMLIRYSFTFG